MAQKALSLTKLAVAFGVSVILSNGAYATGNDEHETKPCHNIPGACDGKPGNPWWAKFPNHHKPQTPPSNPVAVEQNQQQHQKQGDVSGVVKGNNEIKDSGNGYGGVATATSNAGDHKTSLDASDHSSTKYESNHKSSYISIPPVMPPMAPFVSDQGDVKVEVLPCGPLQTVASQDVNGVFVGFTGNDAVYLGQDDKLAPYYEGDKRIRYFEEKDTDGSVRRYGHQPIITTALPAVSGARQFGVGGFGSNGGAQVGAGTSGSMGRLVSKIQLRECELPGYKPVSKEVAQEAPKVQLQTGQIQGLKKVKRSCYRVDEKNPLSKKPASMAICPSQGGVRSYMSTEPGDTRDIITEVKSGTKKYSVDDTTGKFVEQDMK